MDAIKAIESFLNEEIIDTKTVSGGCIANSKIIRTSSGKSYFLKTLSDKPNMFFNEANGLNELAKAKAIRIPRVTLVSSDFLLLEYIKQGAKINNFFVDFGTAFAKMHRHTSSTYGFFENNYIGATAQINLAEGNEKNCWAEFYFNKRLLPQLKISEQNGHGSKTLSAGIHNLEKKITHILSDSHEAPTLLHGDLWSGNFLCDANGDAVLIDPAVYYGHREADLAMTKMFGGFSPEFYLAYQKEFPLPNGWEFRENLYLLYHYLNHLNLFGSGYYNNCINLIQSYN